MSAPHAHPFAALSVDDLFSQALMETDDDRYWLLVQELHIRGSNEVLQAARQLGRSQCADERALAANALAQLGVPERTFPEACVHLLQEMLRAETDPDALHAMLSALSHHEVADIVELAGPFATHPDADVRWAATWCLSGADTGIPLLIQLTRDVDDDVRNWATFGLGTISQADTPELREALVLRLADTYEDARGEALVGLALRHDPRVIPSLIRELETNPNYFALEAAEHSQSPELLAALKRLREAPEGLQDLLDRAIAACTPATPVDAPKIV